MSRRRRPGRDRGSFTAELAAGLPALMLLFLAGLTAVMAMTDRARCLDAAREAATAASRGDPTGPAARLAPDGAEILVGGDPETVTVVVTSRVRVLGGTHLPGLTIQAESAAAREPEQVPW
ncbi:TadE family type IV pilus minor pilin [Actinoplanes sp. DH11]|uniref:TadE family type IV pilus minor pilin n=1 Tax=Actinoplanes sp. DH11 TaxID=2857011 RepID=UPI001E2F9314|nr:TadE family type IV pilus minor pilin [Actinoplanes sp. DH11]